MTGSALDLQSIRARLKEITDGPWLAEYSGEQGDCVIPADADSTREAVCITRLYHRHNDAEFIAHARTDVPALLGEVDQLRDDLDMEAATARSLATYIVAALELLGSKSEDAADLVPLLRARLAESSLQ